MESPNGLFRSFHLTHPNNQLQLPRENLYRTFSDFGWNHPESLFHIEDFESSKFLSLIGEDTIIPQIGPP